jgi:hypothetical protein
VRAAQRPAPIGPLAQLAAAESLTADACLRLRPHVDARVVMGSAGDVVLTSRLPDFAVGRHDVGTVVALVGGGVLRAEMVGMELARRLLLAGLAVPDDTP